MPRNTNVTVGTIQVELTASDATTITIKNCSTSNIYITPTVGQVPPVSTANALELKPDEAFDSVTLAQFFSGVVGANRVYAIADQQNCKVFVSHA